MITRLDATDARIAQAICELLRDAYARELSSLGLQRVASRPPSRGDIAASANAFFGFWREAEILGIVELQMVGGLLAPVTLIASLAVAAKAVRQGIGRSLVGHVLETADGSILVATAARNQPAIRIYEQMGFARHGTSVAADSMRVVHFHRRASSAGGLLQLARRKEFDDLRSEHG